MVGAVPLLRYTTVFKAVWETLGPMKLPWVTVFAPTRCSEQYGKLWDQ